MSANVAIEVHDAHLRACRRGVDEPFSVGPGFALFDDGRVLTGFAARARARLRPRQVHSRFWQALDTSALPGPFPEGWRSADLAHAHLESLWDGIRGGAGEVVLVVPPGASEASLGLLLGIARSLGIPVAGVVDASVAAAAPASQGAPLVVHLDLQLHRAELTRLSAKGELARQELWAGEGWGLVELHEALARRVAEAFVRATRFDPLHLATTEQALYDALPGWLGRLVGSDRIEVELESGGRAHSIELERRVVEDWAAPFVGELVDEVERLRRGQGRALALLTETAASIPGLKRALVGRAGLEIRNLPVAAAAAGALAAHEQIRSDDPGAPVLVRRLALPGAPMAEAGPVPPVPAPPSARVAPTEPPGGPVPTHVLLGDLAHRIDERPLLVGASPPADGRTLALPLETLRPVECRLYRTEDGVMVEDADGSGCAVNGARVAGRAFLQPGDRLKVGQPGIVLALIREAGA